MAMDNRNVSVNQPPAAVSVCFLMAAGASGIIQLPAATKPTTQRVNRERTQCCGLLGKEAVSILSFLGM